MINSSEIASDPLTLVQGPPFLEKDRVATYHHPSGTSFLLRGGSDIAKLVSDPALADDWAEKQAQLMRWTRDNAMFNEADITPISVIFESYFGKRGPLTGRVLDVGGGWGLFRRWWLEGVDSCFVVHDPGAERFMTQPPATLQRLYGKGLAKPIWFVEGFGEELPYQDSSYDMVMIAAALDHCADPARVLKECHRVLRDDGHLLIIQGFDPDEGEMARTGLGLGSRLKRVLSDPRRLHRAIRQRIFHRGDPHIHHFSRSKLVALIAASGFSVPAETVLDTTNGVVAFESAKVVSP